jgi:hypothetical protein
MLAFVSEEHLHLEESKYLNFTTIVKSKMHATAYILHSHHEMRFGNLFPHTHNNFELTNCLNILQNSRFEEFQELIEFQWLTMRLVHSLEIHNSFL